MLGVQKKIDCPIFNAFLAISIISQTNKPIDFSQISFKSWYNIAD